jgi:hypothetical protein
VQKALNTLEPGQIAYIRGGTYSQNLFLSRAGTATAPFTIRNYPGERAVLAAGTGQSDNMALQMGNGAAYVRFQGLAFEGATGSSTTDVYASGSAHDIELSNCEITGSQRQGFFSGPSTSGIQILDCNIHDNGGGGPAHLDHNMYVQGHGHLIANCRIANAPNGSDLQIYPSSDRVIVAENTIVGALLDGIILGSDGGGSTTNATLANNVVAFNGRYGISTFWVASKGPGTSRRRTSPGGTPPASWTEAGSTGSTTRSPTRSSSTWPRATSTSRREAPQSTPPRRSTPRPRTWTAPVAPRAPDRTSAPTSARSPRRADAFCGPGPGPQAQQRSKADLD